MFYNYSILRFKSDQPVNSRVAYPSAINVL
nr:MAG TPA: hypothetical protein [Caudoviricetes sp.]